MPTEPETSEIVLRFRRIFRIENLTHRDRGIREDAEVHLLREGKEAIPQLLEVFQQDWKSYLSYYYRVRRIGTAIKVVG